MTEAYPLYWPEGWPRTDPRRRKGSRFEPGNLAAESRRLRDELVRLGATHVVISTDVPLRRDGLPYTGGQPTDSGVAVYFMLDERQQCIPCDRWATVEENARAIWKSIEALRGLDRWGAKSFVDAAFKGFEALPEPGTTHWRSTLRSDVKTVEDAEQRYREMARRSHPDSPGGSHEMMADLNRAIKAARDELGRKQIGTGDAGTQAQA